MSHPKTDANLDLIIQTIQKRMENEMVLFSQVTFMQKHSRTPF